MNESQREQAIALSRKLMADQIERKERAEKWREEPPVVIPETVPEETVLKWKKEGGKAISEAAWNQMKNVRAGQPRPGEVGVQMVAPNPSKRDMGN